MGNFLCSNDRAFSSHGDASHLSENWSARRFLVLVKGIGVSRNKNNEGSSLSQLGVDVLVYLP